ncbi:MAG: type II secretion system F family protein [Mycobacterium sp.]
MTGPVSAALALSVAVLLPVSPRRRLGPRARLSARTPGPIRRSGAAVAGAIGCCVAISALVLPVNVSLAGAVLGATVAVRGRRQVRHRAAAAEARALETALDVLVGELRVGAHPVRAFGVAATESGPGPVAAGLRAVAARARLGADVGAGLRGAAGTSALPAQWERLALYWQLAGDHGLAISTLMQAAQQDIVERQRFSDRVHAGMAGARASATILAALPMLGVLLGQLIGARPVGFLISGAGGVLLLVGVTLVCAGLLWSDGITGRLT